MYTVGVPGEGALFCVIPTREMGQLTGKVVTGVRSLINTCQKVLKGTIH